MKNFLCALPVLALVAAPSAAPREPEVLAFAPPTDALLRIEHRVQHALATTAMIYRAAGEEQVSSRGFDIASRVELLVSDRVLAFDEGRVERLRRSYDQTRMWVDLRLVEGHDTAGSGPRFETSGDMDGKSVMFTWIDDEQQYARYYDEDEGVEEDLPRLLFALDHAGFLPAEAVEPGASWSVDPGQLRHVVGPGGYLGFDLTGAGDPQLSRALRSGLGTHMYEPFRDDAATGEVRATYTGRREVDERDLAVIEVEFDVQTRADLTGLANQTRTILEREMGVVVEGMVVELALTGRGELLWDTAGGHLASASFEGDETVKAVLGLESNLEPGGREQELALAGTFSASATVRLEPEPSPPAGPTAGPEAAGSKGRR